MVLYLNNFSPGNENNQMNLVLACTATHCEEMKINNAYGTKGSTGKIKRKLFQFETEIIAEYKCSFQMKDEKGGNH